MKRIEPPDSHSLNAAMGWLELGNAAEARIELEKVSAANQDHPDFLGVKWRVHADQQDWAGALEVAQQMVRSWPDQPEGWIHQSYSLHELEQTEEAWRTLLPKAHEMPGCEVIPYNLACYACQLGRAVEAFEWLKCAARRKGKSVIKNMALEDADLEAIRDQIEKW